MAAAGTIGLWRLSAMLDKVFGKNAEASEAFGPLVASGVSWFAELWRDVGDLVARCWNFPNATWGHCCARYRGDSYNAVPVRHPAFRSRSQQVSEDGVLTELQGCPSLDSGCCDVHPRLSQRWKPFSGLWTIKYADGRQHKVHVSDLGQVHVQRHVNKGKSAPSAGALFQFEETPNPQIVRVRPTSMGSGTSQSLSEHWHFTRGVVIVFATTSDGEVVIGRGVRGIDCLGCV